MARRRKIVDRHRPQISERDLNALNESSRRGRRSQLTHGYRGSTGLLSRPSPPGEDVWWRAVLIDGREVGEDNAFHHIPNATAIGYYIEELLGTSELSGIGGWPSSGPVSHTRTGAGAYISTIINAYDGGNRRWWPVPLSGRGGENYFSLEGGQQVWIAPNALIEDGLENTYFEGWKTIDQRFILPSLDIPHAGRAKVVAYTDGDTYTGQPVLSLADGALYVIPDTYFGLGTTGWGAHGLYPTPAVDDIVWVMPSIQGNGVGWRDMTPRIPVKTGTVGVHPTVKLDESKDVIGRLWSTDT